MCVLIFSWICIYYILLYAFMFSVLTVIFVLSFDIVVQQAFSKLVYLQNVIAYKSMGFVNSTRE